MADRARLAEATRVYQVALECHRTNPCEHTENELDSARREMEVIYLEAQVDDGV